MSLNILFPVSKSSDSRVLFLPFLVLYFYKCIKKIVHVSVHWHFLLLSIFSLLACSKTEKKIAQNFMFLNVLQFDFLLHIFHVHIPLRGDSAIKILSRDYRFYSAHRKKMSKFMGETSHVAKWTIFGFFGQTFVTVTQMTHISLPKTLRFTCSNRFLFVLRSRITFYPNFFLISLITWNDFRIS